jgi:four helix bundle protein
MFNFEKPDVWQAAVDLAAQIYDVTKSFPQDERFGLTTQMRRAAVSIAANQAEGNGRTSKRDFQRFIEIAFGSLMEVVSHAAIANRQGLLAESQYTELYSAADRLGQMLSGLRRSLT